MDTTSFFEQYYNSAEVNAILIMNSEGVVLKVNHAFTKNFGYSNEEIQGLHFDVLFTETDNKKNRPGRELETVLEKGQAHDENYLVNKSGRAIWCTGESILVMGADGERYIIKDILNLQSKKQLQLFLKGTDQLLERIFDSGTDIPMIVVDASLKIEKVNSAFLQLFELDNMPLKGCRLMDLQHPFWDSVDLKNIILKILVTNMPVQGTTYSLQAKTGVQKTIQIDSQIIDNQISKSRQVFLILEDITSSV